MDYEAGLAYILEKKEIDIDNNKIVYYEIINSVVGFTCGLNSGIKKFFSLDRTRNLGNSIQTKIDPNAEYNMVNFRTIRQLTLENDNTISVKDFLKRYSDFEGTIYTYNPTDEKFERLTDAKILNAIEKEKNKKKKSYDDSILDGNTDISKMYSEIKKTIISQDEQIMKILTTLFKNQKVVNSNFDDDMIGKLKENLIIYGSTGTGKTEILKRISKIYDIPIVIEDATSLTETGFVGGDVKDMLKNLYLASGKDLEKAQKGILVIDEFDKLSEKEAGRSHVSREGVQRSLLKLLDGSEYYFDGLKFNTSKLSVVALGAFTGITKDDDYSDVSIKNFVDYGIMRELMGRFSKLVAMNSLTKEDIKKILLESNFSPLNTYKLLFEEMNIEFTYDEDFIDYIAEEAVALNSGARSLKTIFDNCISSAMFRIFAGEYASIHLVRPKSEEKPYQLTKKR